MPSVRCLTFGDHREQSAWQGRTNPVRTHLSACLRSSQSDRRRQASLLSAPSSGPPAGKKVKLIGSRTALPRRFVSFLSCKSKQYHWPIKLWVQFQSQQKQRIIYERILSDILLQEKVVAAPRDRQKLRDFNAQHGKAIHLHFVLKYAILVRYRFSNADNGAKGITSLRALSSRQLKNLHSEFSRLTRPSFLFK